MGGSPVAHRTIKGSVKSVESVDIWRGSRRPLRQIFFVLGTGLVVLGRPRERNSSVKLSGAARLSEAGTQWQKPAARRQGVTKFFERGIEEPPSEAREERV